MKHNPPTFEADLDALLAPISAEHPAGESLRYEQTYDLIKEARRADDPNLPQGIYATELKKADWSLVEQLCAEALATRSKDLQLAAWLMEAWVHLHGFAGAREGLALLRGLLEGFWEHLYPEIDDDPGTQDQVRDGLSPGQAFDALSVLLEWLDNKLSFSLKQLPVTEPNVGDLPAYSLADREQADRNEMLTPKDNGKPKDASRLTRARFLNSVTMTPTEFFQDLNAVVGAILEAADALEGVLHARSGQETASLYQFRGVLSTIQAYAAEVLRDREAPAPATSNGTPNTEQLPEPEAMDTPTTSTGIHSRADAYRMLLEAAEYLAKTEPHSPTPYLVRRAVAWGSMSLVEVMQELVKEKSDLSFIYELLGVQEGS
ncbi:MAG: type VI secretion system protein TssA [Bacteroidetes bacterium]|nr:type VI secretion system protein TssA [Bacteroidota bacterium]